MNVFTKSNLVTFFGVLIHDNFCFQFYRRFNIIVSLLVIGIPHVIFSLPIPECIYLGINRAVKSLVDHIQEQLTTDPTDSAWNWPYPDPMQCNAIGAVYTYLTCGQ